MGATLLLLTVAMLPAVSEAESGPTGALLEIDKLVLNELLSAEENSKDAVLRRRSKLAREHIENRLGMATVNGVRFATVVPRQWAIPKDKTTIPLCLQATNVRNTPLRLNLLAFPQVEVRGCGKKELSLGGRKCGTVTLPQRLESPSLAKGQTFTWWKVQGTLSRGPPIEFFHCDVFGYATWMGFSKGTYQVRLWYSNKDQPDRYWIGDVKTPWITVEIK